MKSEVLFKTGLIVLFAFLIYFSYTFITQQQVLNKDIKKIDELKINIEKQNAINEELNEKKDLIGTDEYIEKIAREKLGMVKRNERVFIDIRD